MYTYTHYDKIDKGGKKGISTSSGSANVSSSSTPAIGSLSDHRQHNEWLSRQ